MKPEVVKEVLDDYTKVTGNCQCPDCTTIKTALGRYTRMQTALTEAAKQYRKYEKLHKEKTPPDLDKSETNRQFAEMCEQALKDIQ